MGKYSSSSRRQAAPPRNQVPPLVRGIGCITMVLVPILAYGTAIYLINGPGRSWPIPATCRPLLLMKMNKDPRSGSPRFRTVAKSPAELTRRRIPATST